MSDHHAKALAIDCPHESCTATAGVWCGAGELGPWMHEDRYRKTRDASLARLANAGHTRAIVSEVTRDPNPAPTHTYRADPQSGAGNCVCGMAERHRRHPHEFMPTASQPNLCVCALPPEALPHQARRDSATTATDEQRLFAAGEVRDILAEETGLNPGDVNRVTWRIVNALLPKEES